MSTRTNYFASHPKSYPLTSIPLAPVILPPNPSSTTSSTPSSTTPTTPHPPSPTADSSSAPHTPRRRTRPRPGRQLSITVPPPSRTLQSLVVPVQPVSSSACLRSPFVLRGVTRSPSPRPGAVTVRGEKGERYLWDGFGSGSGQSERDAAASRSRRGVPRRGGYEDLERMPTSASGVYLQVGRRRGRGRPPAIVLAVAASVVFILLTFVVIAPDAIKEALKKHVVKLWNHLCFNEARGVLVKAQAPAPSPEDVKTFMDKW
ncbi:hypothetical protein IAT38_001499 [Cryptococcus sp. DSM 104549]